MKPTIVILMIYGMKNILLITFAAGIFCTRATAIASARIFTKIMKTMAVKKLPKVKDLQAEYAKLLEEKKKTYAEYRRSREEMRELLTAKANVDRLLKMDEEQKKEQEKDHGQR